MRLVRLHAENFRNLSGELFAWVSGVNLVVGPNGEGKTNLLEAVAVLGNLRSFRTTSWGGVVRHGGGSFRLRGVVEVAGRRLELDQSLETGPPVRRTLRVDGVAVEAGDYLQWFPVTPMSSADTQLVAGPPEGRRLLLDRLAFLLRPAHMADVRATRRALRQRTAALKARAAAAEVDAWEERLSAAQARLVRARLDVAAELASRFVDLYLRLGRERFPRLELRYRGESWLEPGATVDDLGERYRRRLALLRDRDRARGWASEGAHRHDLELVAGDRPARSVLSAGQRRVAAAALRLSALEQLEARRDERLPVVLDDFDAELDARALDQLIRTLDGDRQVFLSSAHGERDWRLPRVTRVWMAGGGCVRREPAGETT